MDLELDRSDAIKRLILFLKLRKNKTISDKTISDFDKLLDSMWSNFKSHDNITIHKSTQLEYDAITSALQSVRCGFVELENGGICKLSDVDDLGYYEDKKYRVTTKGVKRDISKIDYKVLMFALFGHS